MPELKISKEPKTKEEYLEVETVIKKLLTF
jgi:hypothetical protein